MRGGSRALALAAAIAVVATTRTAVAGDWELEVHGAGLLTITSSSGEVTKPPRGESFETVVPGVSTAAACRPGTLATVAI
jgi:hypothetical protein